MCGSCSQTAERGHLVLYESGVPFSAYVIDFGDENQGWDLRDVLLSLVAPQRTHHPNRELERQCYSWILQISDRVTPYAKTGEERNPASDCADREVIVIVGGLRAPTRTRTVPKQSSTYAPPNTNRFGRAENRCHVECSN